MWGKRRRRPSICARPVHLILPRVSPYLGIILHKIAQNRTESADWTSIMTSMASSGGYPGHTEMREAQIVLLT